MITISTLREKDPIILKIVGRLDALNANNFEKSTRELLTQYSCNAVFELSDLDYISSAGIRVFLLLINELESANKKIALISPSEMVAEIFEMSGLYDFVRVFDSVDGAVSFFETNAG